MRFDKRVQFLSWSEMSIKDGPQMYKVVLYEEMSGQTFTFYINENRTDVCAVLASCKFGSFLDCTFSLFPQDKLFKLGLSSCELVGGK